MITITTRLIAILTNLRQAISAFAAQQNRAQNLVWLGATAYAPIIPPNAPPPLPAETWGLLYTRLNRMAARFTALFHRWRTATLAEAPQAGRILRPLCHALGLPEPIWLQRPPTPKPQRPATRARAEPEAGPHAQPTPDRPLPPYIRAAARAWKKFDK